MDLYPMVLAFNIGVDLLILKALIFIIFCQ